MIYDIRERERSLGLDVIDMDAYEAEKNWSRMIPKRNARSSCSKKERNRD